MLRRIKKNATSQRAQGNRGEEKISGNLNETLEKFKKAYAYPENSDVTMRNFTISGTNQKACLIFIHTITKADIINEFILSPLVKNTEKNKSIEDLVSAQSVEEKENLEEAMRVINNGNAVLLIEGEAKAYAFKVA